MKGEIFQPFLGRPTDLAKDPDLNVIELLRHKVASALILTSPSDLKCKSCDSLINIHPSLESFVNWVCEDLAERLSTCLELIEDNIDMVSEFMTSASPSGRLALLKRARKAEIQIYFIDKDKTQLLNKKNLLQEEIERQSKQVKKVSILKCMNFQSNCAFLFYSFSKILRFFIEFGQKFCFIFFKNFCDFLSNF